MSKKRKGSVPALFSDRVKDAHRRLTDANNARKSGDVSRAIKLGEALIDDYPDYVAALHTLGLSHLSRSAFWPALSCFMRAAMLNPGDWTILASLAQAYLGLGANEMAARTLEQARAINDDDAEIHYTLGLIYEREREYELATKALQRALVLNEDSSRAAMALGLCQVHLGNQEAAANAFLKSHQLDTAEIGPISASAQLSRQYSRFDEEAALAALADERKKGSDALNARMAFTRAHLFHRKGEFQAAWDQLVAANSLIAKPQAEALRHHVEGRKILSGLIDNFKVPELPTAENSAQPVSLFILGVSRSGKTTVERIVGELPGVKLGYENPIVELAVQRSAQTAGLLTIRALRDLPTSLGDAFAAHYQSKLRARASDARVFTNTHPGRIIDVGHLAARVPNVRFLFVVRDRNDTALRIFMKHFRDGGNLYAYDLQSTFAEIDWYHRTIAAWQNHLPTICRTIEYEHMVEHPREAAATAAELCGLDEVGVGTLQISDDRDCAEPYLPFFDAH